ncbi:MAG: UbiA family prenyltransferase [Verrucomicrobia bacterium]|nr:UbiA family prenyltransferase [Verrucomicrobiota bacterium]
MNEYIRICRIDHWLKNIFIVFGHAVAFVLGPGVDLTWANILVCALSLVPACFIASANYILNEILDAPFDRTHPTKRLRGVAAGKVNVPILWGIKVVLIIAGFMMAFEFFDIGYIIALALLLLSGVVYNVQPLRLKDRAYLDVIAESFNNPIRLWLGVVCAGATSWLRCRLSGAHDHCTGMVVVWSLVDDRQALCGIPLH